MKWQVFFDPAAEKQFAKLGKSAQKDIEKYIAKNLESAQDPRRLASPTFQSRERGVIASATSVWCASFKMKS